MTLVTDIMTPEPITVRGDTSFKEVVDLLLAHTIGGLPVLDEATGGDVVGIITETDLLTKPAYGEEPRRRISAVGAMLSHRAHGWQKKASGLTARELMSHPVVTAAAADPVDVAARRMLERGIGRLPVLEDHRLVGIVSRRDLLRVFHRAGEEIAHDVEAMLGDRVMFEQGHTVAFSVHDGVVSLTGTVPFPHDVALVEHSVRHIPGVVAVNSAVTAERPEPSIHMPERANGFE